MRDLSRNDRESTFEHEGLVRLVCNGCRHRPDHDDIMQEARIAVALASRSFDPGRGIPFGAYAAMQARWAVRNHLSWERHPRRACPGREVSLDSPGEDGDATLADLVPDPEDQYAGIHARIEAGELLRALPEREASVLMMRAWGRTHDEIGKRLGISRARAQQVDTRATHHARHLAEGCLQDRHPSEG